MTAIHLGGHAEAVPRTMDRPFRWLLLGQMILGWAIIQIAGRLGGGAHPAQDEYFLTWPLDNVLSDLLCALVAIAGLLGASAAAGALHPRGAWLLGRSTVLLWPPSVVVEIALSPTSHNLLPFEVLMYGPLALLGIVGAAIGSLVASLCSALGNHWDRTAPGSGPGVDQP